MQDAATPVVSALAPILAEFCHELLARLSRKGVSTETLTSCLLNSPDHPIQLPVTAEGLPLRVDLTVDLVSWGATPRALVRVKVGHSRTRSYKARKNGLPINRITKRLLEDLRAEKEFNHQRAAEFLRSAEAKRRFELLAKQLGVQTSSNNFTLNNVRIRSLPETPTQVVVMAVVTHDQAFKIVTKYGKHQ